MTEELEGQPGAPVAQPLVSPAPIPLPAPGRVSRGTLLAVVATIVVLVLLVVFVAAAIVLGSRYAFSDSGWLPSSIDRPHVAVAWCDDGRRVTAQYEAADGMASVVSLETSSGVAHTQPGHLLVAVEPSAAVAWIVEAPDSSAEPTQALLTAEFGDSPTRKLKVWDLGLNVVSSVREASWRPWMGPAGRSAFLEVDSAKGAFPSGLAFASSKEDGDVPARLPSDVETFVPRGWSPSGAYFAVEETLRDDVVSAARSKDDSKEPPARRVFILDALTGEVVASDEMRSAVGPSAWDGSVDAVVWVKVRPTERGGSDLPAMSPEEQLHEVSVQTVIPATPEAQRGARMLRWPTGRRLPEVWSARIAGSGPGGVVCCVQPRYFEANQIWRAEPEELVHEGQLWTHSETVAWHESGGLAVLTDESEGSDVDGMWVTSPALSLSGIHGDRRRVVWEGPARELDTFD